MARKQEPLPKAVAADAEVTPTDAEVARTAYRKFAVPKFRNLLDATLTPDEERKITVDG